MDKEKSFYEESFAVFSKEKQLNLDSWLSSSHIFSKKERQCCPISSGIEDPLRYEKGRHKKQQFLLYFLFKANVENLINPFYLASRQVYSPQRFKDITYVNLPSEMPIDDLGDVSIEAIGKNCSFFSQAANSLSHEDLQLIPNFYNAILIRVHLLKFCDDTWKWKTYHLLQQKLHRTRNNNQFARLITKTIQIEDIHKRLKWKKINEVLKEIKHPAIQIALEKDKETFENICSENEKLPVTLKELVKRIKEGLSKKKK